VPLDAVKGGGAEIVAKAPADGYALLLANSSLTISGGLYRKLPFDPLADFSPISLIGVTPSLLATNPSVPARTVKEFVELAKARPPTRSPARPTSSSLTRSPCSPRSGPAS
jgi:tripartite-type tricarboxylate transporter receptor subunit TctC